MRFNDLLHLVAFPWKAHGTPPTSGLVAITKMPESRAFSKFSDHFSPYIPLSALSPTGSDRLTGALLDRLTHHVHILEMNGDSYRLRHSRQNAASQVSDEPDDS